MVISFMGDNQVGESGHLGVQHRYDTKIFRSPPSPWTQRNDQSFLALRCSEAGPTVGADLELVAFEHLEYFSSSSGERFNGRFFNFGSVVKPTL